MKYQLKFYNPNSKKWEFWKPTFNTKKDLLDYWKQQPSSKNLKYIMFRKTKQRSTNG